MNTESWLVWHPFSQESVDGSAKDEVHGIFTGRCQSLNTLTLIVWLQEGYLNCKRYCSEHKGFCFGSAGLTWINADKEGLL